MEREVGVREFYETDETDSWLSLLHAAIAKTTAATPERRVRRMQARETEWWLIFRRYVRILAP